MIEGDARQLPRLLARKGADPLTGGRRVSRKVVRLPFARVDLVVTSPPYAGEVGEVDKRAWGRGENLCPQETRNYGTDRSNLGHARGETYLSAMAEIYSACAAVLKPGGFLVIVTKELRAGGALHNLAGGTIALCREVGLLYWQHVIALLTAIRDGELVPRPSFWQLTQVRKALARGERIHLVCHEDVLVFRKPEPRRKAVSARAAATEAVDVRAVSSLAA